MSVGLIQLKSICRRSVGKEKILIWPMLSKQTRHDSEWDSAELSIENNAWKMLFSKNDRVPVVCMNWLMLILRTRVPSTAVNLYLQKGFNCGRVKTWEKTIDDRWKMMMNMLLLWIVLRNRLELDECWHDPNSIPKWRLPEWMTMECSNLVQWNDKNHPVPQYSIQVLDVSIEFLWLMNKHVSDQ